MTAYGKPSKLSSFDYRLMQAVKKRKAERQEVLKEVWRRRAEVYKKLRAKRKK
jgi:hypothetical protein